MLKLQVSQVNRVHSKLLSSSLHQVNICLRLPLSYFQFLILPLCQLRMGIFFFLQCFWFGTFSVGILVVPLSAISPTWGNLLMGIGENDNTVFVFWLFCLLHFLGKGTLC